MHNKPSYEELEKKIIELEGKNAKLSEEQFLLQKIFEKLPVGLQVFDEKGMSIKLNEAHKKIPGLPYPDEGTGIFNVLTDPYSVANGTDKIYAKVYKGEQYTHTYQYNSGITENKRSTGKDKIVWNETIFPVFNHENEIKYVVALLTNITEESRYKDNLLKSEERFYKMFNSNPAAMMIIRYSNGTIVDINDSFIKILGYGREIIGQVRNEINMIDDPKDRETIVELFEKNGRVYNYEVVLKTKTGRKINVVLSMEAIDVNAEPCLLTVITDITVLKQVQQELIHEKLLLKEKNDEFEAQNEEYKQINEELLLAKEKAEANEAQFRLLVENAPEPIFIQIDHKFAYLNRAALNLYGANTEEELLGSYVAERIHPNYTDIVNYRIKLLNENKVIVDSLEYKHLRLDNTPIEVTVSAVPIVFNNTTGALFFVRNITERKLYEERFKRSYNLLNNLAAQVPGVVYQYRLYPDGRSAFPYSSPGMYDIYEVSSEEVREDASPVFTRIHPDDYDHIVETINESARNQSIYHSEFRVILPKQGLRWRHCDAKPQLLEDGSTLWHGIITDITERKLTEEKIKEQQILFETMFNTISDGVVITNKEKKILLANKGIQITFGYLPEEIIGKSTEILYAGKDKCMQNKDEVFDESAFSSDNIYYTCYRDKSEHAFPGETFGTKLYDSKGEWIGNLRIIRNISERVKYIQELKIARENAEKSEEIKSEVLLKLNEAQQIAKIGSWDWNIQSGEVWWSDELYRIFELDPENYSPTFESSTEFVHPDDSFMFRNIALHSIRTGDILDHEFRIITPTGKIKNCRSIAKVYTDKNNKASRMSGTFCDITEQTRIKNELIQAKEKAEESDRLKTAFLHNISHEIRTPMNAIMGFSELLISPDLLPDKSKHYTEMIIRSARQLLSIIDDIINLATIEAGQVKIHECKFELNLMLKFIYHQFLLKAQKQNNVFSLTEPLNKEIVFLSTDKTKLEEVLTNLIGNALKFTQNGSIDFGYQLKDDYLEFFVKDTGIGIPAEMHEEIFKRFRQVDIAETRKYGGAGLGLSISKAYVELLGGKIWLISEPGKGSSFFFTLPVKVIQHIKLSEQHSKSSKHELKLTGTLLIAEDDDSNFLLLNEILSVSNLTILRAKDGDEAVEICKSNPGITLVLMDIKMPVMDGYEATRQIKKIRPELPVIAQTAYASESDRIKALACGCADSITKPINKEQLITVISMCLCNNTGKDDQ